LWNWKFPITNQTVLVILKKCDRLSRSMILSNESGREGEAPEHGLIDRNARGPRRKHVEDFADAPHG
jgi:hypothetical protein